MGLKAPIEEIFDLIPFITAEYFGSYHKTPRSIYLNRLLNVKECFHSSLDFIFIVINFFIFDYM